MLYQIASNMRTLLILALLAFGMSASAQEGATSIRLAPQFDINADSIGLAIMPNAAGVISLKSKAAIAIVKSDEGELLIVGNTTEDFPKGLIVTEKGDTLIINSPSVMILRPKFNSHSEADAELQSGQDYNLIGDRGIYTKP